MGVAIEQLLPQEVYDALVASISSPSSANAFATLADVAALPTIYSADGALTGNRVVNLAGYTLQIGTGSGAVSINTASAPSMLNIAGDVEVIGQAVGVILQDRTTGDRYRVYLNGGGTVLTEAI